MAIPKSFGNWIREQRGSQTATECAGRAGMKVQFWSRIENDDSRRANGQPSQFKAETLEKLAKGLDVPLERVWSAYTRLVGEVAPADAEDVTEVPMADQEEAAPAGTFGLWVLRKREALGMDRAEAAKLAGITRQQWGNIERGDTGTKRETVKKIARALGEDEGEALRAAGFGVTATDPEVERLANALVERLGGDMSAEERELLSLFRATHEALKPAVLESARNLRYVDVAQLVRQFQDSLRWINPADPSLPPGIRGFLRPPGEDAPS